MDLQTFKKKKDYLVCVDSDGCAMDTMDIKHFRCFGPCMVEEWGLGQWGEAILERWNVINLYSMTRGINRFKGLAMALGEIDKTYKKIEGLGAFLDWAETSPELSNSAVEKAIAQGGDTVCLEKALSWSKAVNASITEIPEEDKKPFEGVKEGLALAHELADVAIVSSANLQAVLDEWDMYGLLDHTDIVLAQDAGSKAYCIGELLKKGYEKDHVMMTGDAPGDLKAAESNGVFFYPILVKREKESWSQYGEAVEHLVGGNYGGAYADAKKKEFLDNLAGKNA